MRTTVYQGDASVAQANYPMTTQFEIVQRRPGCLFRMICWTFYLGGWTAAGLLGIMLWIAWEDNAEYYDTTGGIFETYHSGSRDADDKIAIIDVRGVIVDGHSVTDQVERIRNDDSIKAVVIRVESPGGTVTGSDYIFHHLKTMREDLDIPVVVSMGSIAASGGYYISMSVGDQRNSIFAEPATLTGSIGVVLPRYDISELMETYGVADDSIRSHPNKQMLSMTRRMDPAQRDIVQAQVNESFERFKAVIFEGRPELRTDAYDPESDDPIELLSAGGGQDIATGQVFTSSQAIEHGLVDRIGFIEDAIERAAELADVSLDDTKVIRYSRPKPLIEFPDLLLADESASLVELMSRPSYPQSWYLVGTTPPLMPWRNEYEVSE